MLNIIYYMYYISLQTQPLKQAYTKSEWEISLESEREYWPHHFYPRNGPTLIITESKTYAK